MVRPAGAASTRADACNAAATDVRCHATDDDAVGTGRGSPDLVAPPSALGQPGTSSGGLDTPWR